MKHVDECDKQSTSGKCICPVGFGARILKKYKVVGWYSYDAHNEHMRPFARVVYIETDDPMQASSLGSDALDALYEKEAISVDFLNWYTSAVPATPDKEQQ